MNHSGITLPHDQLAAFCQRWQIRKLALFGSVLHEQCGPDSDVDLLVTFEPEADWSLLDHIQMEEKLSVLLGRPVDVVSRRAIERSDNCLRRHAILETAEVVYAAR